MLMLLLKRRRTSDTSGEWSDQEFDVFDQDLVVGRILRSPLAPLDRPWLWAVTIPRTSGANVRGHAENLEAAMARFKLEYGAPILAHGKRATAA